jgi:hypothetical protein
VCTDEVYPSALSQVVSIASFVTLDTKCSVFPWNFSFQVVQQLPLPMIFVNDFVRHSCRRLALGIEHIRIFHFSLGRVFHFSHQPSVKHLRTHILWEEGHDSYVDSHRLSCQETAELWRVLNQCPELFHAGLYMLQGTKCETDLVNQKPV